MDSADSMMVTKRNGQLEEMSFDKILSRIRKIGGEVGIKMNYQALAIKVIDQIFDNISTTKLDELAAEQCASMATQHPDYSTLASRIVISNHQKNTTALFSGAMDQLYSNKNIHGEHAPFISTAFWLFVQKHRAELDEMVCNERDYLIDYFGFKTLEKGYLFKIGPKLVERPQHMWMRVAVAIHMPNECELRQNDKCMSRIKETYDMMSNKCFTHATPTMFNAGTPRQQLSSCYLLSMEEDSLDGIYNTLKDTAIISKYAGGIGLNIHDIRAKGTHIQGTNGSSNGIVPMLRVFNNTARYVDQGGGKRNGSFAIYLEPWHADIFDFLDLKKNHGDDEQRARDLFYALWIPDLFMKRVKEPNGKWSLFCPHECPGLDTSHGAEFEALYVAYELEGKARKTIDARTLWFAILDSQMETGTPYLLYKDSANRKSNQQNLGTIRSSNLCCEIIEYSDSQETAVCNLGSIALPAFVDAKTHTFDHSKLHAAVKVLANNLDRVIDINFYPTDKTKRSNMRHRPIGIGIQGLADTFIIMDIPFHSQEAKDANKEIFETIYHAALEQSNEIAKQRYIDMCDHSVPPRNRVPNNINKYDERVLEFIDETDWPTHSGAYSSFVGSPASKGVLQFDMWNVVPSDRYDWSVLKQSIVTYGLRNSMSVAPMPTASTSQILGYNECFEPITSNIYSRRTMAGEFVIVNKYLMKELIDMGLWNDELKTNIIANKGSVQQLTHLPRHMLEKYKIVWEMPMKHLIDMSADRGAFVCQSQSLNLWMEEPVYGKLTSMHFYAWEKGLKTGIYYLRRKAKHQAQQFTVEPKKGEQQRSENDDICEMCSA